MREWTKRRSDGLILLLLGAVAFLVIGIAWRRVSRIEMGDFKVVYYGARCLLERGDPYSERDVLRVYYAEGQERPTEPVLDRQVKSRYFYPPTAFVFTVPFALLGFTAGGVAWTVLLSGSFILAAIAAWDLAADASPIMSGVLAGLVLMNSFWLFMIGNSAGIAVSLCVVAVWTFYRQRFVLPGVLCLAVSLALKPNDSGLVWLFLLLAGGVFCKRALQSLAVLAISSIPMVAWVTQRSPHWVTELKSNMASLSGIGSIVDPAATGMAGRNMDSLVQLQTVVSIFFEKPQVYDLITYVICAILLLLWVLVAVRYGASANGIWLALAAAAPLSMLPTYHFQHDAKLLMISIPACAVLWARRGLLGWSSLVITVAGILMTGDIFTGARIFLTRGIQVPQPSFLSRFATSVLTRPAPLILLAMAVFYLWALVKTSGESATTGADSSVREEREPNPCETQTTVHKESEASNWLTRRTSRLLKGIREPFERLRLRRIRETLNSNPRRWNGIWGSESGGCVRFGSIETR